MEEFASSIPSNCKMPFVKFMEVCLARSPQNGCRSSMCERCFFGFHRQLAMSVGTDVNLAG